MANSSKYKQQVSRSHVKKMTKRGYKLVGKLVEPDKRQVGLDADIWNIPAYQNKTGWVLVDPDGYPVSPEPREYASQAWDDILGNS